MVSRITDDNIEPSTVSHAEDAATGDSTVAETTSSKTAPSSFLWLTSLDQFLVVSVAVVTVTLLGVKWHQLRYIDRSEIIVQHASDDIGYQIELNSATWIELAQLRGIGETTARRIVSNREEAGPFTSIDDLQRIPGIGPKTVEKNRRWLRVETSFLADD